ncbi:MAG: DUF1513 domain-containing protein [Pseudomonadota bacterium]
MTNRRGFLTGLLASSTTPALSWAAAGNPAFLSSAQLPNGDHVLSGISRSGGVIFDIPLPARGHAGARHPDRAEAVFFARRPGTFAHVINCATGATQRELTTPIGSHFSGHGTFSQDGMLLFTTENDYQAGRGMIGVWDAAGGYARLGAFLSGGIGPHEMLLDHDGQRLIVANGGIETHPDSGRAKLNLPVMRPNLAYLSPTGDLLEVAEPPKHLRRNSIRHIAERTDGTVAIGCQWEGQGHPPVVALHRPGEDLNFEDQLTPLSKAFDGYVGSVAAERSGQRIAASGPRGGRLACYDPQSRQVEVFSSADVCGLAGVKDGFFLSTGTGALLEIQGKSLRPLAQHNRRWDNHLVAI